MDDDFASLPSGSVGSRFVTENEIDVANTRREERWKAAYARIGQEPPSQPVEDSYDGRSLAEKLAANRAAKQEEWEERTKLANQFRALEEDEVRFLDSIRAEQSEKETKLKQEDAIELKAFQKAVAARTSQPDKPSTEKLSPPPPTASKSKLSQIPVKKKKKNLLQGVVIKPKPVNEKTISTTNDNSKSLLAKPAIKGHLNHRDSSKRAREGEESTQVPKKRNRSS